MRLWAKWAAVVLVALLLFASGYGICLYHLAGESKVIEAHFDGTCRKVDGIPGAEDITIRPGGRRAYLSSDDRRATATGNSRPGALYAYDLRRPTKPINLTPSADTTFHPHGIGLWIERGKPDRLFVVNHPGASLFGSNPGDGPGHTIEVFDVRGNKAEHVRTIADPSLVSPNDIVALGPDRFLVTNDHGSSDELGRTAEDFLLLKRANVLYFDGTAFRVAAHGLTYANGINVNRERTQAYVATVTPRQIVVYDLEPESGRLTRKGDIFLGTGVDNIEVDEEGNLWVGAHPQLLTLASYAKNPAETSPSQVLKLTPDDEGGYSASEIFLSRGDDMSGSSVAARHGNRMLIGPVMDAHFLDCTLATPAAPVR